MHSQPESQSNSPSRLDDWAASLRPSTNDLHDDEARQPSRGIDIRTYRNGYRDYFTVNSSASRASRSTRQPSPAGAPVENSTVRSSCVTEDDEEEVRSYIIHLDQLRQECEQRGNFRQAQKCVDRMREVNLRYARKIELDARRVNLGIKERVSEEHRLELLTFSRMWDSKLADYNTKSTRLLQDVRRQHDLDIEKYEKEIDEEVQSKRPRFSKGVIDLRAAIQRFVAQRMYIEAEHAHKTLSALEEEELRMFNTTKERIIVDRLEAFKHHCDTEYTAIVQKVDGGRDELLTARQADFDTLVKRHASEIRNLDQSTQLHISKTRDYVHRQVKAFVKDPLKTGLELSNIAHSTRAHSFRASSQQQRTVPSTSSQFTSSSVSLRSLPPKNATSRSVNKPTISSSTPRGDVRFKY